LTKFIQQDASQLLTWQSSDGSSGLQLALAVVFRLLDPKEGESGGLVVGELVMRLLAGSGDAILEHVPRLLGALIQRMVTAKTATFIQVQSDHLVCSLY
jgi:importin-9